MNRISSPTAGSPLSGCSFGPFRLTAEGVLLRGETPIDLPAWELAVLRLLLSRAGHIVTPRQLLKLQSDRLGLSAQEAPECIAYLCASLAPEECIQTVHKRGYRFIAEVRSDDSIASTTMPRLAIVPFEVGPALPEHLGPTIAEQTYCLLSGLSPAFAFLQPLDSIFTLARRGDSAMEIGRKVNADLMLSGSLHTLPSHYRLRAHMTRPADGRQLWSEDLLIENGRLAWLDTELASRLAMRMTGGELAISACAAGIRHSDSTRGEAYHLFLRAHHEWQTLQRHRMQDGLQHLLRAIELDPSLVAARVDLANLCVTDAFCGFMSPAVSAEMVRRAAEPFREDDPRAEALLPALGWISFHVDRDLAAALRYFSLSTHLPHDPWITRMRVMLALSRHRFGEAMDLLDAAIRIDPYAPWLQARRAWALHLAGRAEESVEQALKALSAFPEHEGACLYAIIVLAFNGQTQRAVALAEDLAQRLPYFDLGTAVHAYALACCGRHDEAGVILERLQWFSRERYVLNTFTPAVYVTLGENDAALRELRRSAEARCPWLFQMLADPRLKPISNRPDFRVMLDFLGAMEEDAASEENPEDGEQIYASAD